MEPERVPACSCPMCSHTLNAVWPVLDTESPIPREGDISICISCGEMLTFDVKLVLRLSTEEEMHEYQTTPDFKGLLHSAARIRAMYILKTGSAPVKRVG